MNKNDQFPEYWKLLLAWGLLLFIVVIINLFK